jgi:hypothetical protein
VNPPAAAPVALPVAAPVDTTGAPVDVAPVASGSVAPTEGGSSITAPSNSVQGASDSGSAAVIGGAVGGSVGALILIGLIILLIVKARGSRPKTLEEDSPFQEPSYVVK